ncbi:hypothetical protein MUO65_07355, partial [bacterium]|nr:hypothetical protein [bacterium]
SELKAFHYFGSAEKNGKEAALPKPYNSGRGYLERGFKARMGIVEGSDKLQEYSKKAVYLRFKRS